MCRVGKSMGNAHFLGVVRGVRSPEVTERGSRVTGHWHSEWQMEQPLLNLVKVHFTRAA